MVPEAGGNTNLKDLSLITDRKLRQGNKYSET